MLAAVDDGLFSERFKSETQDKEERLSSSSKVDGASSSLGIGSNRGKRSCSVTDSASALAIAQNPFSAIAEWSSSGSLVGSSLMSWNLRLGGVGGLGTDFGPRFRAFIKADASGMSSSVLGLGGDDFSMLVALSNMDSSLLSSKSEEDLERSTKVKSLLLIPLRCTDRVLSTR